MKNSAIILLGIAALFAAYSCSRVEETFTGEEVTGPLTFRASLGTESRTAINDGKVSWAAGDKITVFDAAGKSEEFDVTGDCSEFFFTSDGTLGNGPYYAIAGYGALKPTFDASAKQLGVALPAASTDGSFGSADLIASTTSGDSFTFHHVFSIMKMSLLGNNIGKIEFVADGITAASGTKIGFAADGSLDVTYDTKGGSVAIDGIPGAGTYYFAANPGKYSDFTIFLTYPAENKKMKILGGALDLAAGKMMNFGALDGAAGVTEWELVTDASTLAVGDQIVIADAANDYAIGNKAVNNHFAALSVTKSADKSRLAVEPSASVQIFTLAEGYVDNSFAIYNGEKYLAAASSRNNYLDAVTSVTANASWAITIASNGDACFEAQGTRSYKYLYYISSDKEFGCNNAEDAPLAIYRKVEKSGSGPELKEISVFLDETEPGVYSYNAADDVVTPIWQYDIRSGAASTGSDQYAVAPSEENIVFRMQCLAEGRLASVSFSDYDLALGGSYDAAAMFYGITGIDGVSDGTSTRTFIVKKAAENKYWLQEDGSTLALIITTK